MIVLPDNENTAHHLIEYQRAEVEALERGVVVYGGLISDYERRLAEARRRLAETERLLAERERSL